MPKKVQNTEAEAASVVPSEQKEPKKTASASKPRTRTTQPKKEGATPATPKRTTTARAGTATSTSRTRKPTQAASATEENKDGNAVQAEKKTVARSSQKRTATTKKAAEEVTAEQAVASEEKKPTSVEQESAALPALPLSTAQEQGLTVTTPQSKAIGRAVPPVALVEWGEERRHFWGRILLLFLVGALLALSVWILLHRPTRYSSAAHSVVFLYNEESNTTQVLYDGTRCKQELTGMCVRSESDSTGSTCAALVGDTLYLVKGRKVTAVAASVQDFALSQNGRALVYRTAEQKLYYTRTGRKSQVFAVSKDTRDDRYCLSPDGELLFYTYIENTGDGEGKTHADVFSLSGNKPFLPHTTDVIPVAIADDYKHIFYFDANGDLYHMNGEGKISLCRSGESGEMELLFDRECEEVLIRDAKGTALWQEDEKNVLSQLKDAQTLTLLANKRAVYRELPCAKQCLVRSFDENYYLKKGTQDEGVELIYLKKGEIRSIAFVDESESGITVTDKGVYYLIREVAVDEERKHLYRCPIGQTKPVQLSLDVNDFLVNSDGSRLLYADLSGMLYTARVVGNALDSQMVSGVGELELLCVSASDAFYYYAEGVLYVSDNGQPPVAMKENTQLVFADAHTAFFLVPEAEGGNGTVRYTVYTNHRNRRESIEVATGITGFPFAELTSSLLFYII